MFIGTYNIMLDSDGLIRLPAEIQSSLGEKRHAEHFRIVASENRDALFSLVPVDEIQPEAAEDHDGKFTVRIPLAACREYGLEVGEKLVAFGLGNSIEIRRAAGDGELFQVPCESD